jgi:hypothetical protein
MKLPKLSSDMEPYAKELARDLFDFELERNIRELPNERLACILELMSPNPPVLVGDSLKDLSRQILWMLYKVHREGVAWYALAERAYLERTTFWKFRMKVIDMWRGKEQPLFPWAILLSLSFAAIDNNPTPAFLSWWLQLRRLYDQGFTEYGATTKKIAVVRTDHMPIQQKEFAPTR